MRLSEEQLVEIAAGYGLRVTASERLPSGTDSSYLLSTQRGRLVLSIYEKPLARVERMSRLLRHLARHRFPTNRLVADAAGHDVTRFRQHPVVVKRHVEGAVPRAADDSILAQVGSAAARLHRIPPPGYLPDRHPVGWHAVSGIAGRGLDPEFEAWLEEQRRTLEPATPPGLPRALVHGDLFLDNVIVQRRRFAALIDFYDASHTHRIFELAMGAVGLCSVGDRLELARLHSLVAGYQEVDALAAIERDSLQAFVLHAAAATSCWRYRQRYLSPGTEGRDTYELMVRLSARVAAIPAAEFRAAVFG